MPFHFEATGTVAELNAALAAMTTNPDPLNEALRYRASVFATQVWDSTLVNVADTVLNNNLKLTMHGNSDERGISLKVRVDVVKTVGNDVSTATLPNVTLGGTYTGP